MYPKIMRQLNNTGTDLYFGNPTRSEILKKLKPYIRIAVRIEDFRIAHENRQQGNRKDAPDINSIMPAVSLAPERYMSF
jgi:hypothetical protein